MNNELPKKDLPKELEWVEKLSNLMDNSFKIPILNIKFGLDPIIGLIPAVGEVLSFSISALMILGTIRHGISSGLAFKMVGNVLLDTLIGAVPVVGDFLDFASKANQRNLTLLREYHQAGKHTESSKWLFIAVLIALFSIAFAVFYGAWQLGGYVWGLLFGG